VREPTVSGGQRQQAARVTYVTATVQHDAHNLALLDLAQCELRKAFTSVDVVLHVCVLSVSFTLCDCRARTSLLMSTTNTLLRTSVFMPCFRASASSALSAGGSSRAGACATPEASGA
jgi:hypothetical protein